MLTGIVAIIPATLAVQFVADGVLAFVERSGS